MDRGLTNMRGRGETVSVGVGGPGLGLAIVYFFGGGRKSNRHFSSSTYVMCPTFVAWCIGRGVVLGCLVGLNATPRAERTLQPLPLSTSVTSLHCAHVSPLALVPLTQTPHACRSIYTCSIGTPFRVPGGIAGVH